MFKKKCNACLLTAVMALLIVAILVLVKVLFSGAKGFEWGSVSDWFSTAANLVMAGSAFYAAWNAKYWFKIKIKENALNKVSVFLGNCDIFSMEMRNLYLRVKDLNNTSPDNQPKNFSRLINVQLNRIDEIQLKLVALQSEFKSLVFWNVTIKEPTIFNEYFKINSRALLTLGSSISFDIRDTSERLQYNINYGKRLNETSNSLRESHNNLKRNISDLFTFL